MPNPCPTCTAASAWGCPVHAPKHMEAAKPDADLFAQQRRDASLWREVRPLLAAYIKDGEPPKSIADARLTLWVDAHVSSLEAL